MSKVNCNLLWLREFEALVVCLLQKLHPYQTMRQREGESEEDLEEVSSAVALLLQGKPQVPHVLQTHSLQHFRGVSAAVRHLQLTMTLCCSITNICKFAVLLSQS